MRVKNNAQAIERALGLDAGSVKHRGSFIWEGTKDGRVTLVCTEPANYYEGEVKELDILCCFELRT